MEIRITSEDIQNGRRCDPGCCPIGRAISRAGVEHYGVDGSAVLIPDGPGRATSLPLPTEVRTWLLNFDGYLPVEPISFDLPVPA